MRSQWLGALVLFLVFAGGGAYAALDPVGSDGEIDACFERKSGDLKLQKGRKCGKGTKPVSWAQAVPGVHGERGPAGPAGPAGISGLEFVEAPGLFGAGQTSSSFSTPCPGTKKVLGGGVSTFNDDIQVKASTPLDNASRWYVDVETFSGNPIAASSSVITRIMCANVG